jgi:hypothetical protein
MGKRGNQKLIQRECKRNENEEKDRWGKEKKKKNPE